MVGVVKAMAEGVVKAVAEGEAKGKEVMAGVANGDDGGGVSCDAGDASPHLSTVLQIRIHRY